jgi:hypothetical protein
MKRVSVNRLRWLAIPLLGALVFSARGYAQSSLPVVPGAAGYGMNTRAAYACGTSPTIYRVTNLNDSGTGSLREALTASGPRVVIFETSGYINISSSIYVNNPCVTVAGQTAPSPGITVRMVPGAGATDAMFLINTHDVLFQHFRVRPGWGSGMGDSICNSGIQLYGGGEYNVVMDHMSFSWAQDENFMFGYGTSQNGGLTNATVWRSIIAEGLVAAPESGSCGGGGTSGGHGIGSGPTKRVAIVQSLLAHNRERNPWMSNAWALLVNNVTYNWAGIWGHVFSDSTEVGYPGTIQVSAIGNRFIVGPNSEGLNYVYYFERFGGTANTSGHAAYLSDNTVDQASFPSVAVSAFVNKLAYDPRVGSPPSGAPLPSGLSPLSSGSVESFVLANAGARPLDRDAVDQRIVRDVQTRTGRAPSTPSDVGGYPTLSVNRRSLTVPSNPNAVTSSGYTNLEKWLHGYAAAVETGAEISAPQGPPPPTGVRIVS